MNSVEFVHITEGHFHYTAFDKYGQEWRRDSYPSGNPEWIRINGPAVMPLDEEKETLRVQVAGLARGTSSFMSKINSLHRRLSEVEGALAKRKEQNRTDSKQINELLDDLYSLSNHIINLSNAYCVKQLTMWSFEEFKNSWLRKKGYKV